MVVAVADGPADWVGFVIYAAVAVAAAVLLARRVRADLWGKPTPPTGE